MNRVEVLKEAEKQITGHRQRDYGTPENNFELISAYWTLYKGIEFSAHDVAMMMALLKVARIQNGGGSGDSHVDLVGYGALAGELYSAEENISVEDTLNRINDMYGVNIHYESKGEKE